MALQLQEAKSASEDDRSQAQAAASAAEAVEHLLAELETSMCGGKSQVTRSRLPMLPPHHQVSEVMIDHPALAQSHKI